MLRHSSEIRKISAGPNPNDSFAMFVEQTFKLKGIDYEVSNIIEDTQSFNMFGVTRYNVYLRKIGGGKEILWKAYENVPVSIEYKIDSKTEMIA